MSGTDNTNAYLVNAANLEKLRSNKSDKDFSKICGFASGKS